MGGQQPGLEIWDPSTGIVELVLDHFGDETPTSGLVLSQLILLPGEDMINIHVILQHLHAGHTENKQLVARGTNQYEVNSNTS